MLFYMYTSLQNSLEATDNQIHVRLAKVKKILPPELVMSKEQRLVNEFPGFYENNDESYGHEMDGK